MADLVTVTPLDEDAIWRVTFGGSKGNILDAATMAALDRMFIDAREARALRAIVLEGAGAHFSFGASVQEHLPGEVAGMLAGFRRLLIHLLESDTILLAAVRGQCLGGGLELASLAHRIFASPEAKLGQPEIVLGVFAPIASIVLPHRLGRARGEDLCLTGRTVGASEARDMGLVDEIVTDDPADAAIAWARTHLVARSASSLRLAVRAVRADVTERIRTELPRLETLYLEDLMKTHDAVEGLEAFLAKRPPHWRHA
jgi:cyclohexa-1,5-dienecarbonyl-CoA hydratase